MGVLVKIAAGAEIAKAALEVAEKIKAAFPSRSVVIQVHNHTDHTLRLQAHDHSSGVFGELPSFRIPPQTVDIYGSRRRGRPEGASGWVRYSIEGQDATVTVEWRLRWRSWRSRSSSGRVEGRGGHEFQLEHLMGGSTSQGEAKFELSPQDAEIIIESGGGGSSAGNRPTGPLRPGGRPISAQ